MAGLYELLMRMRTNGGQIVLSEACTVDELVLARHTDRVFVDGDGVWYVYLPPQQPAPPRKPP